jgi:hypothetical protein
MDHNANPEWLDQALLDFGDNNFFTFRHAFEGTAIIAASGWGKTTGPGKDLILALMGNGAGMVLHTTKWGEAQTYIELARLAGRQDDVRVVGANGRYRTNILEYTFRPPESRGTHLTDNVVSLISRLRELRDGARGASAEFFWEASSDVENTCAIDLLGFAGEAISFEAIHQCIASAPTPEEVKSEHWQSSFLNRLIDKAIANKNLTESQKSDLGVAIDYWLSIRPRMDEKTRAGVVATGTSITHRFRRGLIGELCGTTTNLTPEDVFRGAITILDIPTKEYGESGQLFQALWRLMFMRAAERRNLSKFPRPVALIADEAQHFITKEDTLAAATFRSARVANVIMTQNLDSIRSRFSGPSATYEAECLLGNFNLKIFGAQDHVPTNEWASKMIGEEFREISTVTANMGPHAGMSAGTHSQRRALVEPIEFMRLAKATKGQMEGVLFRAGRPFSNGQHHLKVLFSQLRKG